MKIHIIRHGDPDYSIDSLTEKGWREAELLSNRIVKMKINEFYASPLGRAQDTAKATMEKLNATYEVLPWLHEFAGKVISLYSGKEKVAWDISPSDWANNEIYYDKDRCYETDLMNSGSVLPKQIYEQTKSGIDELLLKYGYRRDGMLYHTECESKKEIALFCHFGIGSIIFAYLTGISPVVAIHNLFMAPTSVTTLVTETDKNGNAHFRCVQMGDTSHLYIENEPVSESGLYPDFYK